MKAIRVAVLACALGFVASAASANLITNGSFELGTNPNVFTTVGTGSSAITGWDILAGNVDYIGTYWTAAQGVRSVDLDGNQAGTIGQTFATVAGQSYRVQFAMAGNPDGAPVVKALLANAGSASEDFTFDTAGKTRSAMGWTYFDFLFTASGPSTNLSFKSLSPVSTNCTTCYFGAALDDVSVEAVPEPGSMLLLGSGLLGLAARRRKRT